MYLEVKLAVTTAGVAYSITSFLSPPIFRSTEIFSSLMADSSNDFGTNVAERRFEKDRRALSMISVTMARFRVADLKERNPLSNIQLEGSNTTERYKNPTAAEFASQFTREQLRRVLQSSSRFPKMLSRTSYGSLTDRLHAPKFLWETAGPELLFIGELVRAEARHQVVGFGPKALGLGRMANVASNSPECDTGTKQDAAVRTDYQVINVAQHDEKAMVSDDQSEDDESEDDENGSEEDVDEDGFPMVEDPSDDILEDLDAAPSGDLDFVGTFAFSKTYGDAPNPALYLEDLGTIGLPLSSREAKAVIAKSIQAPFGQGERTVVDKEVRDTWEMDVSKVKFEEPAWTAFMHRVVQEVCQALGVNFQASQPRIPLHLNFLPHVDTEKPNGMFASIIVVLPSRFTGGDAHVSHGSLKNVFNTSVPSATKTTVFSWYTDVMHEIVRDFFRPVVESTLTLETQKPITSDYRFALSYNLFHTINSLRPSLASKSEAIENLRHVLLSWKQQVADPAKVIYMLDHTYSRACLSGSALKGKDAHILSVLDSLAKELGFHLGLVHIKHHVQGTADDDFGGGYYSGRRTRCYYDEDSENDDVDMAEVLDSTTTIENLVDLDGKLISKTLSYDDESETIPANFEEYLKQYEGYQGNYAGTVDRFYRSSTLVIWPKWTRLGDGQIDRRTAHALQRLLSLEGPEHTTEESELFEYICRSSGYHSDPRLVMRDSWTVAKGRSLGNSRGTRASVRNLVSGDSSVSAQLKYLTNLENWAQQAGHLEILTFVQTMRSLTFDNLSFVNTSDLTSLTEEAMKCGGVQRLKQSILPQLAKLTTSSTDTPQAYVAHLHGAMHRLAPSVADQSLLREIITELLTSVLARLDLFQITTSNYSLYNPVTTLVGNPATAKKFISQCLDTGNLNIASAALKRMAGITRQKETVARAQAMTDPKTRPFLPELPLATVSEATIPWALKDIEASGGSISKEAISSLLDAVVLSGTPQLLVTTILPKIQSLPWNEESWKRCMEELYSRRRVTSLSTSITTALAEMAKVYAQKIALPHVPTAQIASRYDYGGVQHGQTAQILCIVSDSCLQLGGAAALVIFLKRVFQQKLTSVYLSSALVPFIPVLLENSKPYGLSATSEPLASTVRITMNGWAKEVLGPKPNEAAAKPLLTNLNRLTCNQSYCVTVRKFLSTPSAERVAHLRQIGAPARRHVEKELESYGRGAATFETIRTTPQGLTVAKSDALYQPSRWKATQKQGLQVLQKIGNEKVLEKIWGEGYLAFMSQMNGDASKTTTPATAPRAGPSQTQRARAPARPPPGPSVPVTPAKRKADEIIDLTTP
ncbi:hypothetical protein L218DRAFT_950169 [Marasmius fiardii PR-910]|nr:hypothetical protein L218DRAFT_950169 [Marasmius fiardii PR-910]